MALQVEIEYYSKQVIISNKSMTRKQIWSWRTQNCGTRQIRGHRFRFRHSNIHRGPRKSQGRVKIQFFGSLTCSKLSGQIVRPNGMFFLGHKILFHFCCLFHFTYSMGDMMENGKRIYDVLGQAKSRTLPLTLINLTLINSNNTTTSTLYGMANLSFFDLNSFTKMSLMIFMILGKIEIVAVLFLIKKLTFRE